MAIVIQGRQKNNGIGEGLANLITSATKSYQNTHDESALQKSIQGLAPNASPREILDAITNTKTYSPEAKQNALKNYMGVAEFEEVQRKHKEQQELKKAEEERQTLEAEREQQNIDAILEQLDIPEEKKIALRGRLSTGTAESLLKDQIKDAKSEVKQDEKTENALAGLKTIERMRELGKKGNLGRGSQFTKLLGGETAKDFGEYEQLGKSLIQLSTNIPIRNRQEFEVLAHKLYDPSIADMEREGILNALETVIKSSLEKSAVEPAKSERPPLSSFQR